MRKLSLIMIMLIEIVSVQAFFANPFSILDASDLANINLKINITNLEDVFCTQGGNCTFTNLTYTTVNYNSYNVTGNINATGNISGTYIFGLVNYSDIIMWDWSDVYNNIQSYIEDDFYTKAQADAKFCTTCTGGGGGGSGTDDTRIYLFNSMKQDVIWNISKSDFLDYNFYIEDNVILTPIGGELI